MPKTSPNDRCPCGSGKKYKRCCMESGRAAAFFSERLVSAPALSPDLEIAELTAAFSRGDMGPIAEALDLVTPLLRKGGPLGAIRFDENRFGKALAAALDRHGDVADDAARRDRVLAACVRDSCDARDAKNLVRRMEAALRGGGLPPAAQGALAFWIASTEAALKTGGDLFAGSPLLLAVAGVQADELADQRADAAALLESLVKGLRDRSLSLADLDRAMEAHGDELAALLEATPGATELVDFALSRARAGTQTASRRSPPTTRAWACASAPRGRARPQRSLERCHRPPTEGSGSRAAARRVALVSGRAREAKACRPIDRLESAGSALVLLLNVVLDLRRPPAP